MNSELYGWFQGIHTGGAHSFRTPIAILVILIYLNIIIIKGRGVVMVGRRWGVYRNSGVGTCLWHLKGAHFSGMKMGHTQGEDGENTPSAAHKPITGTST